MPILKVESEVNGRVAAVLVQAGQPVAADDVLAILESMKMEISLVAPSAGTVSAVHAVVGEVVEEGQLLFELA